MNKKILSLILFSLLCVLMFTTNVFASANTQKKYIFKFKDNLVGKFENTIFQDCKKLVDHLKLYVSGDKKLCELLYKLDVIDYYEETAEFELFYDISDTGYQNQYFHSMIGTPYAFDLGNFGNEVTVAVIDSGVSSHNDLNANVLPGYNTYDNSSNCSDSANHGTAVAGIIASQINGIGGVGVSPCAKIIPIKCFRGSTTATEYIVPAIYKAIELKVDIINMSFGSTSNSEALKEAIDEAHKNGIIIVAAVGNSNNSTLCYPAAYDNVIGVGNINSNKEPGVGTQYNSSVFVTAPGTDIYSTNRYGSYSGNFSGTSFACPVVTGALALAMCVKPDITTEEFKNALINTSLDYGEVGYDTTYGYGILNIPALLKYFLKDKSVYISPLYETYTGNSFVNVTNLSDKEKKLYGGIYSQNTFEAKSLSLSKGQTKTIEALGYYDKYSIILGEYIRKSNNFSYVPDGDINNDGVCNQDDIGILTQFLLNPKINLSSYKMYKANMNQDDYIDIRDAVLMNKAVKNTVTE